MSRVSRSPPLYIRNIISHLFMRVGLKHKFYRRMPFLSPNSRIAAPRGAEWFYRDTITKLIVRQDSRGSVHPMSVCHHWAIVLICIGDHCTNYHTQRRVTQVHAIWDYCKPQRHLQGERDFPCIYNSIHRTLRVPDKSIPICNAPLNPVVQLELRTYKHEIAQSTQEKQKHKICRDRDIRQHQEE